MFKVSINDYCQHIHKRYISHNCNFDDKNQLILFFEFLHYHEVVHDNEEFSHGNLKTCCESQILKNSPVESNPVFQWSSICDRLMSVGFPLRAKNVSKYEKCLYLYPKLIWNGLFVHLKLIWNGLFVQFKYLNATPCIFAWRSLLKSTLLFHFLNY